MAGERASLMLHDAPGFAPRRAHAPDRSERGAGAADLPRNSPRAAYKKGLKFIDAARPPRVHGGSL